MGSGNTICVKENSGLYKYSYFRSKVFTIWPNFVYSLHSQNMLTLEETMYRVAYKNIKRTY